MTLSDAVSILSTITLGSVALWYTIETRRMRLEAAKQVRIFRDQYRLTVAPFVGASIRILPAEEYTSRVKEDDFLGPKSKKRLLDRSTDSVSRLACIWSNPTDELARNLYGWYYSTSHASFLELVHGQEWLAKGDHVEILVSDEHRTEDQVKKRIKVLFGDAALFAMPMIKPTDAPYVFMLFQDLLGRVYFYQRSYECDAGSEKMFALGSEFLMGP